MKQKAQIGIEYLILLGFVTFSIMIILVLAAFYSDQIKDSIRLNQVESFSIQLIDSAESVFFAGEPSKTSISLYLPEGIIDITINGLFLETSVSTSSGINKRSFKSLVPLQGTISPGEGIKKLSLEATEDFVQIS